MAVGQDQWDPILVGIGEFTTHSRTNFSVWIGMFIGGTIWVLTHSHVAGPSWSQMLRPVDLRCSVLDWLIHHFGRGRRMSARSAHVWHLSKI